MGGSRSSPSPSPPSRGREDPAVPRGRDGRRGAKAKEAGICIIGGHTVKDKEPKFGLSVTGRVHPTGCGTTGARRPRRHRPDEAPGDRHRHLGDQVGICPKETEEAVTGSMARLNANAAKAGGRSDLHGTDVTGFGLIGHLLEVLEGSGLAAEIGGRTFRSSPGCGS